jgi:hypothetical protein
MRKETEMSSRTVIGVYDSLAKAERAELYLEDAHLPVGQMSLIAPKMEAGEVERDFTAREVAKAIASIGVQPPKERIARYEQALKTGKHLLIFHGDAEQVAEAYRALENTPHSELTLLDG